LIEFSISLKGVWENAVDFFVVFGRENFFGSRKKSLIGGHFYRIYAKYIKQHF
jgi:hypothetical protein